jgi:hypothetical protein
MFKIDVTALHWMEGTSPATDLCLHGHTVAAIGDETLEYDATVSATALYLLKTLKKEHRMGEGENPMLPCCGFFLIADDTLSSVEIMGCPNGVDFSVLHESGQIVLVTESGKRTVVPTEEYKEAVFAFADKIEAFYRSSAKKVLPDDAFERNGYIAFWNEWKRLREA